MKFKYEYLLPSSVFLYNSPLSFPFSFSLPFPLAENIIALTITEKSGLSGGRGKNGWAVQDSGSSVK
jgi:hypothetical protein